MGIRLLDGDYGLAIEERLCESSLNGSIVFE